MDFYQARQKRDFRLRLYAFLLVHILIGLHLVLWYVYDWTLIGAIDMQELFRNFIEKNVLTAGALFFLITIGVGLIWGRVFCGWFCHIGQSYDLLAVLYRKLKIPMYNFPLRFGAVTAFFVMLWYFLREALVNRSKGVPEQVVIDWGLTEPWELLPGWGKAILILGIVLFVLPIFLGRRSFCRNLCPWGVVLGLSNFFNPVKVRRTGVCTMCGECNCACPMDIDVSRRINTALSVNSVACTNCLQCVSACPTQALSFSLPNKTYREPQNRELLEPQRPIPLVMELGFWIMTVAVGLIYSQLYGIGIFLAWSLGLLVARLCLSLIGFIRSGHFLRRFGVVLCLLALWGFIAHDGVAHWHMHQGNKAWEARDLASVQHHYEKSDAMLWTTPNIMLYRMYMIYKGSRQEEKRQWIYDRYERRREVQGKRD